MEQNPENSTGSESRNKTTVIIVILVLLAANAFLLWQFFNKKQENVVLSEEKTALITSKDSISLEYEAMKIDLSRIQSEYTDLEGKLTENEDAMKVQKDRIERLMRDNASIPTLRKELEKLKEMKSAYEIKIADLEKENLVLKNENQVLNTDLTGERSKNDNLSKENQGLSNKVALGSILKADDISSIGVRYKSSGKEFPEKKAKNVEKIKTCFSIMDNLVVEKGNIDIFIRILGPDKSVLSTTSSTFSYNGQQLPYTQKQEIQYNNKRNDQCVYWEKGSLYVKGKYAVEIYASGNKIGIGEFELK